VRWSLAVVNLPRSLRDLADTPERADVEAATVLDALRRLEGRHPRLAGWVLDEQGLLRPHVSVFRNGERVGAEDPIGPDDELYVLPAISGGAEEAELLVGTRKGLVVLRGPRGGRMGVAGRAFPGSTVEFAIHDRRTGTYLASVTFGQYGPHLYLTKDPLGDWEEAEGPAFPPEAEAAVSRIWVIQPGIEDGVIWAGVAPAALFRSEDGGRSWELNRGLWDHPTRPSWQPGAGGLCLHSIALWPGDPSRLAVGISAAGVWLTADGGKSWERGVAGLVPRYLPPEAQEDAVDLCVHHLHRSPVEPETLYLQFHGGVYRSDDAGRRWVDIGSDGGLPSDFGFPLVVDPHDPDRALVIPLVSDEDRVTPEGKVRVYETGDRGATWRALHRGLPQEQAHLTILRQAFCHDGGRPLGLYFGAESGEVFGSADGGQTWGTVAERLPPVLSVRPSA
jgi:photosystem II stability/assembly factor-like uncharacterized protein/molybdopterin converting factor small subunit